MGGQSASFRCAVDGVAHLVNLRDAALPMNLRSWPARRSAHRDLYLDTEDGSLERRGILCRLRYQANDRRYLALILDRSIYPDGDSCEARVSAADDQQVVRGMSRPARQLRGFIDPGLLQPKVEVETERWIRQAAAWPLPIPQLRFGYDVCTVRRDGLSRTFEELFVERILAGGPSLDAVAARLERDHGLRPLAMSRAERGSQLAAAMASEAAARLVSTQRAVAVLCWDDDRIAFIETPRDLSLPVAWGSGEEACRFLLRELFNSGVGELSLLGLSPGSDDRPAIEVWIARRIRSRYEPNAGFNVLWLTLSTALDWVRTPERFSAETLAALALVARFNLEVPSPNGNGSGAEPISRATAPRSLEPKPIVPTPGRRRAGAGRRQPRADQLLNAGLSQLAFLERVLDLADQPGLPAAERLRYCAIASSLLDELFATRVAGLRTLVVEGSTRTSPDGLSPAAQLDAIAARVPSIMSRMADLGERCLTAYRARGHRLRRWPDLDAATRDLLRQRFEQQILPALTPRALTESPGHPFPAIPHLTLSFVVELQPIDDGPPHYAYLALPSRLGRFMEIPEAGGLIPIGDIVRANIGAVYPGRVVESAWLFRLTRGIDLDLDFDDDDGGDRLQSVEEDLRRRLFNAAVRLEVERDMPAEIRALLLREFRFERRGIVTPMGHPDLYPVSGLIDQTFFADLAKALPPADHYPAVRRRNPVPTDRSIFDVIDQGDLLVQHPLDDFEATVVRFLETGSNDPAVIAIKIILYRVGDQSPIVKALVHAAENGIEVVAFVEVRARLDEERNAHWVKRLEASGVRVVYGIVGLKTHAKAALIVRKTAHGVNRYVHIGTGNYNSSTARSYTDLGLFTADPMITADLVDLFNELTGSTGGPKATYRRLLVAPEGLRDGLIQRIRREVEHAEGGRPALIRAQLNGLDFPELIAELYRGSKAGVTVQLIVRGICTLRPGMEGVSERITVKSILGRFLEHQRIVHFANGGLDEYWIGSADWRTRNLCDRVELMVPVIRHDLKMQLGGVLDRMWAEPSAWALGADGRYTRSFDSPKAPHVHEAMFEPSWPLSDDRADSVPIGT